MAVGEDDGGDAVAGAVAAVAGVDGLELAGGESGVVVAFVLGGGEVDVADEGKAFAVDTIGVGGTVVGVEDVAALLVFSVRGDGKEADAGGLVGVAEGGGG